MGPPSDDVCFSALLSSYLLGEQLNVLGKLGCLLSVLGSVLLVLHAPREQEVTSLQEMTEMLLQPGEMETERELSAFQPRHVHREAQTVVS